MGLKSIDWQTESLQGCNTISGTNKEEVIVGDFSIHLITDFEAASN